jgi:hypothetical protein
LPPHNDLSGVSLIDEPEARPNLASRRSESLSKLNKLYQSATQDRADEMTAFSALEYVTLVEKEVLMLGAKQDAWLRAQATAKGQRHG